MFFQNQDSMEIEILNLGNRHEVEEQMRQIGVTEEGIALMAPKYLFKIIKLKQVRNAVANILKQEMLSLGGEAAVHKYTVNCKVEKTDVLLAGTLKIYFKLIRKLKGQVLGMTEIAQKIESQIKV